MRVAVFILATLLATALVMGALVLVLVTAPSHPGALVILPSVAVVLFVYGPIMLGSVSAYWGVTQTPESRRSFRSWLLIVGGLELLAAIGVIVYSILEPVPLWLPFVLIASTVVLTFAAIAVGRAVLRHETSTRPIQTNWSPISRRDVRRKCVKVAVTFVVALVVAAVALIGVFLGIGSKTRSLAGLLPLAFELALFAAAFACIIVTLPLNRQLRDTVGRDLGTIRKVAKVVLRRKSIPLDESEQVAAAKYAAVISTVLSFTLGYIALLYVGLAVQQLSALGDGAGAYSFGTLALLVIVLLVLFPLQVVRIRRARRYAADHADLLPIR
jgi:hypothetical protein